MCFKWCGSSSNNSLDRGITCHLSLEWKRKGMLVGISIVQYVLFSNVLWWRLCKFPFPGGLGSISSQFSGWKWVGDQWCGHRLDVGEIYRGFSQRICLQNLVIQEHHFIRLGTLCNLGANGDLSNCFSKELLFSFSESLWDLSVGIQP